jgi:Tfp pilus assembly protein PilF
MVVLVGGVGCSGPKKPTQKQQVTQRWNSTRAAVLHSLARDQYNTGNLEKSRKTVSEAIALDPKHVPLRVLSAKLAIEQGKLDVAAEELKLALELAPKDTEANYLSGVVYQRWQQPEKALGYYHAASEQAPNELAYLMAEAEMLVALDHADEALQLLQARVVFFEQSGAIRDAVGELLVQQGRYSEAVEVLRQASILDEQDATIREHLALALYYNKEYRDSAQVLERLLADPERAERADLLTALGQCQLQLGKVRDARYTLERASQLCGSSAAIWLALARATMQLGDTKRADMSLQKALSLEPDNSDAYLLQGYLRLRTNKLSEALASLKKANALDAANTVSLCMAGYVMERTGKPEQAMHYYAKALKVHPGDELATRLLAGLQLAE